MPKLTRINKDDLAPSGIREYSNVLDDAYRVHLGTFGPTNEPSNPWCCGTNALGMSLFFALKMQIDETTLKYGAARIGPYSGGAR
jgi:hypothetical protein